MKENIFELENKFFFTLTSIILFLGLFFCISNLTKESFWLDESYTARITNNSFSDIFKLMEVDFQPPLYYFLVKIFRLIGGNSIFVIRLCSVFGFLALASLGMTAVRRVFGNKTGFVYTLLIITTPIFFSMAQEARMYTWAPFFVNGVVLYGYIAITTGKISDWIKFGLFMLGAVYTHYYALLAVIIINLFFLFWIIISCRKKFQTYIVTVILVILFYLPWVSIFFHQISVAKTQGFWIPEVTLTKVLQILFIPFGDKFSYSSGLFNLKSFAYFTAIIFISFGLFKMIKKKQNGYFLNLLAFSTYFILILIVIIVSILFHPILQERYIIIVAGLFILSLAIGISSIEKKSVFTGAFILMISLILPNIYHIYHERFNGPMDEVVSYIKPYLTEDTVFIHYDEINVGTFCYYFPKSTHFLYDPNIKGYSYSYLTKKDPFYVGSDLSSFLKNKKNIWIITKTGDQKEIDLSNSFIESRMMMPVSKRKNFALPFSWYRVSIQRFSQESDKNNSFVNFLDGEWFYFNDNKNKGTSKIIINGKVSAQFEMRSEIIDSFQKDIALLEGSVTNDYAYGFIGMGLKPDTESIQKLSKAKGIKFKVIGDNKKYKCILSSSNVSDYNYFTNEFIAFDQVTVYKILFSEFKQENWGKKVDLNTKLINSIEFQTVGQPQEKVLLKMFDLEVLE